MDRTREEGGREERRKDEVGVMEEEEKRGARASDRMRKMKRKQTVNEKRERVKKTKRMQIHVR